MARSYAKISTALWQSRKFKSLRASNEARLLYFYLHSCPQVNQIGCFVLPTGYVVTDLGWTEEAVVEAMDALASAGLISWDRQEEIVRIVDFIEHDPPTNLKHAGAMFALARDLHDGPDKAAVVRDLLARKHLPSEAETAELRLILNRLSAPEDRLSGTQTEPLAPSLPYPTLPNPTPPNPTGGGAGASPPDEADDGFEEFFNAMPRRENRVKALAAYREALAKTDRATLLAGARAYAAAAHGRSREHVSPPAKWLADERWTDSVGPPSRDGTIHASWGERASAVRNALGEDKFFAYFAEAKLDADSDPPRILASSAIRADLMRRHARPLSKIFGDGLVIEVAA